MPDCQPSGEVPHFHRYNQIIKYVGVFTKLKKKILPDLLLIILNKFTYFNRALPNQVQCILILWCPTKCGINTTGIDHKYSRDTALHVKVKHRNWYNMIYCPFWNLSAY